MSGKIHATERDQAILMLLDASGFVPFQTLLQHVSTSQAALRRDLERLQMDGRLVRVQVGAQVPVGTQHSHRAHLQAVPLHEAINYHYTAKMAIGKEVAGLCHPGEAIIIDGGSTTLQMRPHLESLRLQILTNSLPIIGALLQQPNTRVSIAGGVVFRE